MNKIIKAFSIAQNYRSVTVHHFDAKTKQQIGSTKINTPTGWTRRARYQMLKGALEQHSLQMPSYQSNKIRVSQL